MYEKKKYPENIKKKNNSITINVLKFLDIYLYHLIFKVYFKSNINSCISNKYLIYVFGKLYLT